MHRQTTIIGSYGNTASALTVREKQGRHSVTALTCSLLMCHLCSVEITAVFIMIGRPAPSEPHSQTYHFVILIVILYYMCMGVLNTGMSMPGAHRSQKSISESLKLEVIDGHMLPCGCWELKLSPL